jgi:hypothetical protein
VSVLWDTLSVSCAAIRATYAALVPDVVAAATAATAVTVRLHQRLQLMLMLVRVRVMTVLCKLILLLALQQRQVNSPSKRCTPVCSFTCKHHSSDDSSMASSSSCNIVVCAHWISPCIRLLAVCLTGTHCTIHTITLYMCAGGGSSAMDDEDALLKQVYT